VAHLHGTDDSHSVTTLELFFDLVFVFALTQITTLMARDPTWRGAAHGLVLLALLWWAWCSYAWLGNQAKADEGLIRAALIVTMGAMFVVALAIPESFGDGPGGPFAPFVLAACYAVARVTHLAVYLVAAGGDVELRRQLLITAIPVGMACVLLVIGGAVGPPAQSLLWTGALFVDYSGIWLTGTSGWRLPSAKHFAERHGLIVIVALGESVVSIGVGVADRPLSWAVLVASLVGLGVSVCLWWIYFDVVALVAERVLLRKRGEQRSRLARDSFTYLHFPMVAGVVYLALGMKEVLGYVAGGGGHALSDPLATMPLVSMYAGVAAYLFALASLRWRNLGRPNVARLVVSVGVLLVIPVVAVLPALASLGVLLAVLSGLVTFEATRHAEARQAIRHAEHQAPA
jgi:low temperature requirement protein LtrA